MSSLRNQLSRLPLLAALALASSCAGPAALHPPVADLTAAVESKPLPTDEIATDQKAYDLYQAEIEAWGDRIYSAGGRLCRWSQTTYKVKVPGCPK